MYPFYSENIWILFFSGCSAVFLAISASLLALLSALERALIVHPGGTHIKRIKTCIRVVFLLSLSWFASLYLMKKISESLDSLPEIVKGPLLRRYQRYTINNWLFIYFATHLPWCSTYLLDNKDSEVWCLAIVRKPMQWAVRLCVYGVLSLTRVLSYPLSKLPRPINWLARFCLDTALLVATGVISVADRVIGIISYVILFYFWIHTMIFIGIGLACTLPFRLVLLVLKSLCFIIARLCSSIMYAGGKAVSMIRILSTGWLGYALFLCVNVLVTYTTVVWIQREKSSSTQRFVIMGSHNEDVEWLAKGLQHEFLSADVYTVKTPSEWIQLHDSHEFRLKKWNEQEGTHNIIVDKISTSRFARDPFERYQSYIVALEGKPLIVALRGGTCEDYRGLMYKEDDPNFLGNCMKDPKVSDYALSCMLSQVTE